MYSDLNARSRRNMSGNTDSYYGSEYNYAYTYITAQIAIVGVKISVCTCISCLTHHNIPIRVDICEIKIVKHILPRGSVALDL